MYIQNQHLGATPKPSYLFISFLPFLFISPVLDGKRCLNAEKNYFDKQTMCEAPVHWSKYTTETI